MNSGNLYSSLIDNLIAENLTVAYESLSSRLKVLDFSTVDFDNLTYFEKENIENESYCLIPDGNDSMNISFNFESFVGIQIRRHAHVVNGEPAEGDLAVVADEIDFDDDVLPESFRCYRDDQVGPVNVEARHVDGLPEPQLDQAGCVKEAHRGGIAEAIGITIHVVGVFFRINDLVVFVVRPSNRH